MKSYNDDGGRAFPFAYETSHPEEHGINCGMTLRDYFAAKAMQGFAADPAMAAVSASRISEAAYMWADAMLKERAK
jgi:hypothetical protein